MHTNAKTFNLSVLVKKYINNLSKKYAELCMNIYMRIN